MASASMRIHLDELASAQTSFFKQVSDRHAFIETVSVPEGSERDATQFEFVPNFVVEGVFPRGPNLMAEAWHDVRVGNTVRSAVMIACRATLHITQKHDITHYMDQMAISIEMLEVANRALDVEFIDGFTSKQFTPFNFTSPHMGPAPLNQSIAGIRACNVRFVSAGLREIIHTLQFWQTRGVAAFNTNAVDVLKEAFKKKDIRVVSQQLRAELKIIFTGIPEEVVHYVQIINGFAEIRNHLSVLFPKKINAKHTHEFKLGLICKSAQTANNLVFWLHDHSDGKTPVSSDVSEVAVRLLRTVQILLKHRRIEIVNAITAQSLPRCHISARITQHQPYVLEDAIVLALNAGTLFANMKMYDRTRARLELILANGLAFMNRLTDIEARAPLAGILPMNVHVTKMPLTTDLQVFMDGVSIIHDSSKIDFSGDTAEASWKTIESVGADRISLITNTWIAHHESPVFTAIVKEVNHIDAMGRAGGEPVETFMPERIRMVQFVMSVDNLPGFRAEVRFGILSKIGSEFENMDVKPSEHELEIIDTMRTRIVFRSHDYVWNRCDYDPIPTEFSAIVMPQHARMAVWTAAVHLFETRSKISDSDMPAFRVSAANKTVFTEYDPLLKESLVNPKGGPTSLSENEVRRDSVVKRGSFMRVLCQKLLVPEPTCNVLVAAAAIANLLADAFGASVDSADNQSVSVDLARTFQFMQRVFDSDKLFLTHVRRPKTDRAFGSVFSMRDQIVGRDAIHTAEEGFGDGIKMDWTTFGSTKPTIRTTVAPSGFFAEAGALVMNSHDENDPLQFALRQLPAVKWGSDDISDNERRQAGTLVQSDAETSSFQYFDRRFKRMMIMNSGIVRHAFDRFNSAAKSLQVSRGIVLAKSLIFERAVHLSMSDSTVPRPLFDHMASVITAPGIELVGPDIAKTTPFPGDHRSIHPPGFDPQATLETVVVPDFSNASISILSGDARDSIAWGFRGEIADFSRRWTVKLRSIQEGSRISPTLQNSFDRDLNRMITKMIASSGASKGPPTVNVDLQIQDVDEKLLALRWTISQIVDLSLKANSRFVAPFPETAKLINETESLIHEEAILMRDHVSSLRGLKDIVLRALENLDKLDLEELTEDQRTRASNILNEFIDFTDTQEIRGNPANLPSNPEEMLAEMESGFSRDFAAAFGTWVFSQEAQKILTKDSDLEKMHTILRTTIPEFLPGERPTIPNDREAALRRARVAEIGATNYSQFYSTATIALCEATGVIATVVAFAQKLQLRPGHGKQAWFSGIDLKVFSSKSGTGRNDSVFSTGDGSTSMDSRRRQDEFNKWLAGVPVPNPKIPEERLHSGMIALADIPTKEQLTNISVPSARAVSISWSGVGDVIQTILTSKSVSSAFRLVLKWMSERNGVKADIMDDVKTRNDVDYVCKIRMGNPVRVDTVQSKNGSLFSLVAATHTVKMTNALDIVKGDG